MPYHIIFWNFKIYNAVKSVKVYTAEVTWFIATRICFIKDHSIDKVRYVALGTLWWESRYLEKSVISMQNPVVYIII